MRLAVGSYGPVRAIVHALTAMMLLVAAPALAAERLVLAFGDSLSAGYRLKPGQSFPAQLETRLRKEGLAVRVHNAGVSGDTSAAGRARLGWVLNSLKTKPSLVILELGANDMLRGLSPARTETNLDAMMAELRRRKIPVLLAGMRSAPNLGRAYQQQFDAIYPKLARRYRAPLYPFFLEGVIQRPALLLPDRMHPNAAGVAVIVRGIAPMVKQALKAGG